MFVSWLVRVCTSVEIVEGFESGRHCVEVVLLIYGSIYLRNNIF